MNERKKETKRKKGVLQRTERLQLKEEWQGDMEVGVDGGGGGGGEGEKRPDAIRLHSRE